MKRFISMMLAVLMLVSVMSVSVFAADTDDANDYTASKTWDHYFEINTEDGSLIIDNTYSISWIDCLALLKDFIANNDTECAKAMTYFMQQLKDANGNVEQAIASLDEYLKANDFSEEAIETIESMIKAAAEKIDVEDFIDKIKSGAIDLDTVKETIENIFGEDLSDDTVEKIIEEIKNSDFSGLDVEEIYKALLDIIDKFDFSDIDLDDIISKIKSGNFDFDSIKAALEELFGKKIDDSIIEKIIDAIKNFDISKLSKEEIINYITNLINGGSSDSTAKTESDEEKLLEDVSFDTVNHNAYINGYTDKTFKAYKQITRAETAKIIYSLLTTESVEKYGTNTNSFSDVNASAWYNTYVSTLANIGAISGYADGTFKPNQTITRAEFVKIVMSIAGVSSTATTTFSDVKSGSWYYTYVATAQTDGYVQGSTGANGEFRPNDTMTRAEAVTFMNNVLGRTADTTYISSNSKAVTSFTDVQSGVWYYGAVMEAANGHNYSKDTSGVESWTGIK